MLPSKARLDPFFIHELNPGFFPGFRLTKRTLETAIYPGLVQGFTIASTQGLAQGSTKGLACLLYTSDAADE